ncbi:hypothetical protein LPN01_05345 [Sphingomonas sp. A2-49]|uniref:hypothetical protein n=1 Tax=Sphingomonas sp. A2-49 TaxID=1391375 RepID=UPI0021CF294B|nr:hypothetical protein [Sphingomonas sp. A2-49]MCU6453496.1 hypothetical protein [Sphingomonas sp. A2-49]
MSPTMRNAILAFSMVLMIALQPLTLMAMVVAPECTGIGKQANTYKIVSIIVFSVAYCLLARRWQSWIAAVAIPVAQIALGWWFLFYVNSLPMTCPQ